MHTRHVHAGAQAKPCLRSTFRCSNLQPAKVQRQRRGPSIVRAGVVDTLLKPLTQSGQVPLFCDLPTALPCTAPRLPRRHNKQLIADRAG